MKNMKKDLPPVFIGFWLGHLVTSALLLGWAMLGLSLYFMGSSDLWYDVAGFLLALLPPLMAGGLTRKFRPHVGKKALWTASLCDAALLGALWGINRSLEWENFFLSLLLTDGTALAAWVPPLMERLGTFPYDARMLARDVVGLFLPSLVFTLGCLLARRPEED